MYVCVYVCVCVCVCVCVSVCKFVLQNILLWIAGLSEGFSIMWVQGIRGEQSTGTLISSREVRRISWASMVRRVRRVRRVSVHTFGR
jgi:hypothetical protein